MNSPEQLLSEHGFYAAAVHGQSMEPLLFDHRDVVYIETAPAYRKRDVVLFRRANGQLVLHRLIRCDGDTLWACGDNDFVPEKIASSQILGRMTAYTRNGRTTDIRAFSYRLYSAIWCLSMPTKRFLQRVYQHGRRRR